MAKKATNKKTADKKSSEKNQKSNSVFGATMRIFLAGCVAELWVLILQKYFVNGNIDQVLAFADVMENVIPFLSGGLAVLGVVLAVVWRASKRRDIGIWVAVAGVFLGVSCWLAYAFNPTGVSVMGTAVPVLTLLGLAFYLYQREFFWSLSILGLGVLDVWACRRGLSHANVSTVILAGTVALMVALVAVLLLFRRAEQSGGKLGKLALLPADASYGAVYSACGVSVVAMAVALISTAATYYLLWALVLFAFALTVYYTVKQL